MLAGYAFLLGASTLLLVSPLAIAVSPTLALPHGNNESQGWRANRNLKYCLLVHTEARLILCGTDTVHGRPAAAIALEAWLVCHLGSLHHRTARLQVMLGNALGCTRLPSLPLLQVQPISGSQVSMQKFGIPS